MDPFQIRNCLFQNSMIVLLYSGTIWTICAIRCNLIWLWCVYPQWFYVTRIFSGWLPTMLFCLDAWLGALYYCYQSNVRIPCHCKMLQMQVDADVIFWQYVAHCCSRLLDDVSKNILIVVVNNSCEKSLKPANSILGSWMHGFYFGIFQIHFQVIFWSGLMELQVWCMFFLSEYLGTQISAVSVLELILGHVDCNWIVPSVLCIHIYQRELV